MTTHELAAELLTHPNVHVCVEGWTSDHIMVIQPYWAKQGKEDVDPSVPPDARILINGDHHAETLKAKQ